MKTSRINIGKTLTAALLLGMSLNVACAPAMKGQFSKASALAEAHVWYDGDRERKVWINPQMVADFNPDAAKHSKLQTANLSATPHQRNKHNGINIWQLDKISSSTSGASIAAIKSLQTTQPAGKYSPVFHDGPSNSATMRALPGNIFVYLNPLWDSAAVTAWLKSHQFEIVKKLEIGPNIYLLKTGPGMEALDTANKLYKSGEVKAAFPDWWQEVTAQ